MTGPEQPALAAIERPALDEVLAAAAQLVDDAPAAELAPDVVDVGPPDPAPAAWVAAVRALIDEHPDLPPLDGDPASAERSHGRWVLHPWMICRDLHALLAWAEHLDGPISVWGPGADGLLHVCGLIAGQPTALIGHSARLAQRGPGLDVAGLQQRRADEDRQWDNLAPPAAVAP